ncbi:ATP-binding protein [Methanolobus profundi]|uniref:histidine kinase n=1 Tax=Methanolobus profundi TaxID=487685 RepID=A0A1I4PC29_9EURY|nr:ATP-binding protein [Methanolobus profundi]SFM25368.1 PAS/PAC sensor signal transduction histidine kinase [Methanolobus profundi]
MKNGSCHLETKLRGLVSDIDNFSIRTKMILTVVGIILILGILMGSYLNLVQTSMMSAELDEKGISITRNLAENSINPILTDNQVRLQWLIETIRDSESEVVYVFIADEQGDILVHTFQDGFPIDLYSINPAIGGSSIMLLDTEVGYVRDISYPILEGKAGEVHVGMSQEHIRSNVDKFTISLGLFVLMLMFIGSNVAYFAGSVVSRPILELKEGVEIFGEGDLDHKVMINSNNEVGQLANSFNDMADHIGYLIKEKEKVAKEVLETRNYLTKIVSGSLDGIAVIDDGGEVEFVNDSFIRIARSGKEWIIGSSIYSFFQEKEDELRSFLTSADRNATFMKELNFTDMDGRLKVVILSMGSVEYRGEIKYVAVAKDITEIKRLEQTKANIIANISHELRTPLNIMKGYVEISMEEQDSEKRYSYLNRSLKALDRQNIMIQDLLEIARGEDGVHDMDLVMTSINGIVEMACKVFNGKLSTSDIEVMKKFSEDKHVKADPEKLTYALTKLIDNALKFTEKGGLIEIGTSPVDGGTRVYVKDTGIGISENDMEHIFDRFYQVDSSSTRKFGGNGLGLTIASSIIAGHNSRLLVISEYGKGSTFYFVIPDHSDH